MTETLAHVLQERADSARFEALDLEAITRAGARAVRRRRWAGGVGVMAAVVAAAGLTSVPWPGDRSAGPAAPPLASGLSWTTGSVLHTPSGDVELGHEVAAYVRTDAGYVFTDGRQVFSYVGGDVRSVGTIQSLTATEDAPRMVGDTDGSLAAWPDGDAFVVLDQTSGVVQRISVPGTPTLEGVDGRTLYAFGPGGTTAVDVDTGASEQSADEQLAWEDGHVVVVVRRGTSNSLTLDGQAIGPQGVLPDRVAFSPDGSRLSVNWGDSPLVFDTATLLRVPIPLPHGTMSTAYQWLDDDTLGLLVLRTPESHYQLVTCSLPADSCTVVVADLGPGLTDGLRFRLPVGEPYYPYPHG